MVSYAQTLATLEKDIGDINAWKDLRDVIDKGSQDLSTLTEAMETRVFLLNLLELVTPSQMQLPEGKVLNTGKIMDEYLRTKRIQTCPVLRDVSIDNAAYVVQSSMSEPYFGSGKHTFGEVAVMMFLCGEILPKSKKYYKMSQSPVALVEGGKSLAADIDQGQLRMMRNIHLAMIQRGDYEAADYLKRSMVINGATEESVTYIEWSIRVESKHSRVVDPTRIMESPPKNLSAHMLRVERKHVSREMAANSPERLDLPENFLRAMLTASPLLDFIAVIRIGKFSWTFVISKNARIGTSDLDISALSDILIKQVLVDKDVNARNLIDA